MQQASNLTKNPLNMLSSQNISQRKSKAFIYPKHTHTHTHTHKSLTNFMFQKQVKIV